MFTQSGNEVLCVWAKCTQWYESKVFHRELLPYLEDPENKDEHEYNLDQEDEELSEDLRDDDLSDIDSSHPGPVHQSLLPLLDQHHCCQTN